MEDISAPRRRTRLNAGGLYCGIEGRGSDVCSGFGDDIEELTAAKLPTESDL
ncbi:Hypothetical protein SMAX5B_011793 [Scophthalmus maximus]|uniref:Uncharacterized protein n=1 Tax=Scophthalmus maximus TaxID=52904 RepID=A0A2U9AZ20_SCOMX|nr:Hypothetical protein SMAX5B_011793 [Scophthalmus maximus]